MKKVEIVKKDDKKYIDGEEVLCEYDCRTNWIVVRFVLSLLLLIGLSKHYFFTLHQYDFESIFVVGLLLVVFVIWINVDVRTVLNKGIYITQNHIITFSGKKIPLEDVFYRWVGGGIEWGSIALELYEKNRLLLHCLKKDNKNFSCMIETLQKITNNINLGTWNLRDGKRKLIQKGGQDD